jgi:hypothetical protein
VQLSLPQLIMHILAIMLFGAVLTLAQNRSLRKLNMRVRQWDGAVTMIAATSIAFWTGYYTLYIPFDILFLMLAIGGVNAIRMRSLMNSPREWMWQSMLTALLGAGAGIGIGFAAFFLGVMSLSGVLHDIALWLAISIPAGLVTAYVSGRFLKAQTVEVSGRDEHEARGYRLQHEFDNATAEAV